MDTISKIAGAADNVGPGASPTEQRYKKLRQVFGAVFKVDPTSIYDVIHHCLHVHFVLSQSISQSGRTHHLARLSSAVKARSLVSGLACQYISHFRTALYDRIKHA